MDGIYSSILPIMRQSMSQANGGKTLSAEETRKIELLSSKLGEILKREMSWAKFEPIQRAIYRENFDQVEIDGLITFYQSAVGQSFINKMPMITQKSMAVMPAFIQEVMPRIQSEMQKIVADVESGKLK